MIMAIAVVVVLAVVLAVAVAVRASGQRTGCRTDEFHTFSFSIVWPSIVVLGQMMHSSGYTSEYGE